MRKVVITIMLCGIFAVLPACGSSSSSSDNSSSGGSPQPAYVGTWHIHAQTLLGGGTSTTLSGGSLSSGLVMDISSENAQLIIGENSWVTMDNDPTSGCESVTLSLSVTDDTWESVITANNGVCSYGAVGATYTGAWSIDGNGYLTWTMGTLVSWYSEPVT